MRGQANNTATNINSLTRFCAICGAEFPVQFPSLYTFKLKLPNRYACSWTCFRKLKKKWKVK